MSTEKRLIDANCIPYQKSGFPKGDGFDSRLDWAFREDIDKLPTVDAVEVVRGNWLKPSEQGLPKKFDNFGAVCSACEFYCESPNNYCPNCGCKMDAETIKRQAEYVYEGVSRYCEAIDKNNLVNEIVEEMRNALR